MATPKCLIEVANQADYTFSNVRDGDLVIHNNTLNSGIFMGYDSTTSNALMSVTDTMVRFGGSNAGVSLSNGIIQTGGVARLTNTGLLQNIANYKQQNWNSRSLYPSPSFPYSPSNIYFKVATFGTSNDTANSGLVSIIGTMGGYSSAQVGHVNIQVGTRDSAYVHGVVTGYMPSSITDLTLYREADNTYGMYIKASSYFEFDLLIGGSGGTISLQSPSATLTTPTGTVVYSSILGSLSTRLLGTVNVSTLVHTTPIHIAFYGAPSSPYTVATTEYYLKFSSYTNQNWTPSYNAQNGLAIPANGIYFLSLTLHTSSTTEFYISKNGGILTSANGNTLAAQVISGGGEASCSTTAYLTTSDVIYFGVFNSTSSSYQGRSTASITLLQRT